MLPLRLLYPRWQDCRTGQQNMTVTSTGSLQTEQHGRLHTARHGTARHGTAGYQTLEMTLSGGELQELKDVPRRFAMRSDKSLFCWSTSYSAARFADFPVALTSLKGAPVKLKIWYQGTVGRLL